MDFTVNTPIGICATLHLDLLTNANANANKLILEDKKGKRQDLIGPCLRDKVRRTFFLIV